jgi:hypothetical protein
MKYLTFCIIICSLLQGCSGKNIQTPLLSATKNYERDMIVTVNGVTREGTITMPLLPQNTIHIIARGDLDTFLMKSCGGIYKKQKSWNVTKVVPSGLFGWGSRKIEVKNEAEFTIAANDFHETGICPLYLVGISNSDGQHSEAYINWQTPEYKLGGYLVCNMEKRAFQGVEACSIASGSYTKVVFDEEVVVSPKSGCDIGATTGKSFEWRVSSGTCNYEFKSVTTGKRGMYSVYGWDEIILR